MMVVVLPLLIKARGSESEGEASNFLIRSGCSESASWCEILLQITVLKMKPLLLEDNEILGVYSMLAIRCASDCACWYDKKEKSKCNKKLQYG